MRKKAFFLGLLVFAVLIGIVFISCPDDSKANVVSYEGVDQLGNKYILTITENQNRAAASYIGAPGDSYVLVIKFKDGTEKKSTGVVKEVNSSDGTLTLQPSVAESETFSLVISNGEVTSVTGSIVVDEGEIITPRTFNTIYMRVVRWVNEETTEWGHKWDNGWSINFFDFFNSNLDKKSLYGKNIKISLSGNIDKDINAPSIELNWVNKGEWIYHILYKGTDEIKAGNFNRDFFVTIPNEMDFEQEGDIMVLFANNFVYADPRTEYYIYPQGLIPDIYPDGTIMATIKKFSISIEEVN